jgi:Flp pilus assembly protein TadG
MANRYLRKDLIPSAATETIIYSVPEACTSIVPSLRVTNSNASTASITVTTYQSGSATAYNLMKSYVLPPNNTLDVFSGVSCVLESGDTLKVTASVATVHFHLSYLETDRT